MELHTLRFFKTIADEGGFTSASEKLNYAQSNLSTQIRNLEKELGTPLFYRQKKGVMLTSKGKEFYEYAQQILSLAEESVSALQDTDHAHGKLVIGSLEATALIDLPDLLSVYHRNYPDVLLSLITDMNDVFVNQVLDRKIDGAFIMRTQGDPQIKQVFFKNEDLILVGGNNPEYTDAYSILSQAHLITFPQGSIFRRRLELLLTSLDIVYENRLTVLNSLAAMIINIISGLGYGYIPRKVAEMYMKQGLMKEFPIDDPYSMLDIVFIYRKDHLMNAAFRYFLEML